MAKLIFETTCVSEKGDGSSHVVLHGATDSKESFRGPPPNSTLSIWPKGEALASFVVGKKYELVEVKPEPVVAEPVAEVKPETETPKAE